MTAVREVTAATFDREVMHADGPVLVDFWAPWCGPCRALMPVIEDLAEDHADTARVVKVNVEQEPDVMTRFGLSTLPALLLFRDGAIRERLIGVQSRARLSALLDDAG